MRNIVTGFKKEVVLHGKNILYIHKVSNRTRTMKLAVYHDGSFVVTTPKRITENIISNFIHTKADWIIEKIEYFKNNPRPQTVKHTQDEIIEYKKKAQEILTTKLPYFASLYQVAYKNVTVKNISSRWGSCSSKGNLNFNYKIALLPGELVDYVIVHELCHLREMNHSQNFWKLVEEIVPNHRVLRKQLKGVIL